MRPYQHPQPMYHNPFYSGHTLQILPAEMQATNLEHRHGPGGQTIDMGGPQNTSQPVNVEMWTAHAEQPHHMQARDIHHFGGQTFCMGEPQQTAKPAIAELRTPFIEQPSNMQAWDVHGSEAGVFDMGSQQQVRQPMDLQNQSAESLQFPDPSLLTHKTVPSWQTHPIASGQSSLPNTDQFMLDLELFPLLGNDEDLMFGMELPEDVPISQDIPQTGLGIAYSCQTGLAPPQPSLEMQQTHFQQNHQFDPPMQVTAPNGGFFPQEASTFPQDQLAGIQGHNATSFAPGPMMAPCAIQYVPPTKSQIKRMETIRQLNEVHDALCRGEGTEEFVDGLHKRLAASIKTLGIMRRQAIKANKRSASPTDKLPGGTKRVKAPKDKASPEKASSERESSPKASSAPPAQSHGSAGEYLPVTVNAP